MKPIIRVPEGTYYAAVEGSRGEFGVFLERDVYKRQDKGRKEVEYYCFKSYFHVV